MNKKKLRSTGYLNKWNEASQKPGFMMLALILGVTLIFGAPLLASDDDEPAAPASGHQAEEAAHDDAHADPAHGEETHDEVGHGDAAHGAAGDHHGDEGHHGGGAVHPPTLVSIIVSLIEGHSIHSPDEAKNPVARFLATYNGVIYSLIVILILFWIFKTGTRSLTMIPGKFQNVLEWVVEGLNSFIGGVLGPEGKRFVPFLGTLFLYIYFQNIFGLIPLGFTSTSMIETTAAMALVVFVYVQFTALRSHGLGGYLFHLAGEPRDVVGWCMAPLMFPIHVVGELAKPLSLSLRLFGNMMGGETLLAVFMGLGVTMIAFANLPVGIPMQTPFIFLELLVTLVQALVFTLLATIYFSMVLPHHDHSEAH